MKHNWVFQYNWYGRGSHDWDHYKCTNCGLTLLHADNETFKEGNYQKTECSGEREPIDIGYVYEPLL